MNGRAQWFLPFGAAIAMVGAAYTVGLKDGGGASSVSNLDRRIERLDSDISELEGRVQNLSKTQNLLEFRVQQLQKKTNGNGRVR